MPTNIFLNMNSLTIGGFIALSGTGLFTLIGVFAVVRYQVRETKRKLEENTLLFNAALQKKAEARDLKEDIKLVREKINSESKEIKAEVKAVEAKQNAHDIEHKELDKTLAETAISLQYIKESMEGLVGSVKFLVESQK